MRLVRLAAMLGVISLAVVAGVAMVGASLDPTEAELREMAGLTGRYELRIGVSDDHPGLSSWDEDVNQYRGFEIDIAHLIAADLGFRPSEVEFFPIETEKRHIMQARDGDGFTSVDLVVASYSITKAREQRERVMFSEPYLRSTQSVVTGDGHDKVESLGDLRGESVCTLVTATSLPELEEAGLDRKVTRKNKISDCVKGLLDGDFDAVTTDAAILAGWVHQHVGDLKQHDIGSDAVERYGVSVGDNKALRTLVNLALFRSLNDTGDDRWEEAFDVHLRPLQRANRPQQVAEGEQPSVDEPRVRRWPWEDWTSDPWAARTGQPAEAR